MVLDLDGARTVCASLFVASGRCMDLSRIIAQSRYQHAAARDAEDDVIVGGTGEPGHANGIPRPHVQLATRRVAFRGNRAGGRASFTALCQYC